MSKENDIYLYNTLILKYVSKKQTFFEQTDVVLPATIQNLHF